MSLDGVCDVCGGDERTYTDTETGTEFCIRCRFRRWERTAAPAVLARRAASIGPKRRPPKPKSPPKPKPKRKPKPKPKPKPKRKPGDPRTRERYVAAGLCARCGGERDDPDRRTCGRCRGRAVAWERRYRAKAPADPARVKAAREERIRKRRAAGLCARCRAKRDPDRATCARCRKRAADAARDHRARGGAAG